MAPSPWWTDRAGVSDLLRRAGAAGAVARGRQRLPRADAEVVHFPEQGVLPPAPAVGRAAAAAPTFAAPPAKPLAPPTFDGDAPLVERLQAYAEWLLATTDVSATFVADADGLPLVTLGASEDHVAVSAALDQSLAQIRHWLQGDPPVSVVIELEEGGVLELLWSSTAAGRMAVGVVRPEPLTRVAATAVRDALRAACATSERGS